MSSKNNEEIATSIICICYSSRIATNHMFHILGEVG